ncbi:hypothetical protein [Pontibacter ramchanderi]|uniref:Uncharacterized protein n=1 Tax=Pontibacter ramchanderi TaxID=1179743 RepID=A0A2N3U8R3_9BACT|nr:hypothetical protein [Pontibacter ramchanderi]PKV63126.1 hypothetical protein BD749_2965 [Pontibacter ramchanderi]
MNSAIAVFFASLISGAFSFGDLRPALSDMVQILTGVQITEQTTSETRQEASCSTIPATDEERLYLSSDMSKHQNLGCEEAAYDQQTVYVL